MYRQFGSSAVLFLVLTSTVFHLTGTGSSIPGGSAAIGSSSAPGAISASKPPSDDASKRYDDAFLTLAVQRCYPFAILRRYKGNLEDPLEETPKEVAPCALPPQDAHKQQDALNWVFDSASSGTQSAPSATPDPPSGMETPTGMQNWLLVATVPDPLQTAGQLEFDRDISALQEAASTAGYNFDSILIPWSIADLREPLDANNARKAKYYRSHLAGKPGALLFRKRGDDNPAREDEASDVDHLLLILLVPESPAYGLNMHAALEAIDAVKTLRSAGFQFSAPGEAAPGATDKLRWIGPNYSASAPDFSLLATSTPGVKFSALSGDISTAAGAKLLQQYAPSQTQTPTLTEQDADSLDFLTQQPWMKRVSLARNEGGYGLGLEGWQEAVFVLQEDQTAYGTQFRNLDKVQPKEHILYRSFPRGISRLRSVYGSQLHNLSLNAPQTPSNQSAASNLDFNDALQQPADSSPEFAAQSPTSDESVLASLAGDIQHSHPAAVVILATDPLDQIFLTRYFHRACPDVRLVLLNADRLLAHLRGDFDVDGTLVVTRYPLFQNSYLQTPFLGGSRHALTFTSSNQEAVYLAALSQIAPGHQLMQSPYVGSEAPPTPWIAVISGGEYWPVAYLGNPIHADISNTPNQYAITDAPPEHLPPLWFGSLLAAVLLSLLHCALFWAANGGNVVLSRSDRCVVRDMAASDLLRFHLLYTPASHESPKEPRQELKFYCAHSYWLLNVTIQCMAMICFLLLPALMYEHQMVDWTSWFAGAEDFLLRIGILSLAATLTLVVLLWLGLRLHMRIRKKALSSRVANDRAYEVLSLVSFAWLFFAIVCFSHQLFTPQSGWTFAIRCLHLGSGACPILPLLLVCGGFAASAFVHLNGLSIAINRDPGIPSIDWLYLDFSGLKAKLDDYLCDCWRLPLPDSALLLVAVVLIWIIFKPWLAFATFDLPAIGWLYTINLVVSTIIILRLWIRFVRTWHILRNILERLEGSPLRFAFSRLPKIFTLDPVWTYSGLRRSMVLPMRWLEYLRVAPAIVPEPVELKQNKLQLLIIRGEIEREEWLDSNVTSSFAKLQNEYAKKLSEQPRVISAWNRGGPDFCIARAATSDQRDNSENVDSKDSSASAKHRPDIPSPCGCVFDESDCNVQLANEYIAMRITTYLRYVTIQMRNMMTFMTTGVLLLLLAAVSYPFNQPQVIAWGLTIFVAAMLFSVGSTFVQMDRDAILSRLSETAPGKVNFGAFLTHMLAVGGLPVVTVLSSLFPTVGTFLFSWARPLLDGLH